MHMVEPHDYADNIINTYSMVDSNVNGIMNGYAIKMDY